LHLLILASCISFTRNNCEKNSLHKNQEAHSKYYVNADQIELTQEGILIILENFKLLAIRIFHDEHGFYYSEDGVKWICRNCGALNDLE
jgi:hypothetical protein